MSTLQQPDVLPAPPAPAALPDSPMTALLHAALGPLHAPAYLAVFQRFDDRGRTFATWNTTAALLTLNWMILRQMWTPALIYLTVFEGLGLLLLVLLQPLLGLPTGVVGGLLAALVLLSCVVPGMWGNALLYQALQKKINHAITLSSTMQEARAVLARNAPTQRRLQWLVAVNALLGLALVLALLLWPTQRPPSASPAPTEQTAPTATVASSPFLQPSAPLASVPLPDAPASQPDTPPTVDPNSSPAEARPDQPDPVAATAPARPDVPAAALPATKASATAPGATAAPAPTASAAAVPAAAVPTAAASAAADTSAAPAARASAPAPKTEKANKADKPEKTDKTDKADKTDKTDKPGKTNKAEKAEKVEKADKAEPTAQSKITAAQAKALATSKPPATDSPAPPTPTAARAQASNAASAATATASTASTATAAPTTAAASAAPPSTAAPAAAPRPSPDAPATGASADAATTPTIGSASGYYINVGLFADEANARKAQARLLDEGLPAFRQEVDMPKGRRIRVRTGPHASRAEAEKAARSIRALGLDAVIFQQKS